MRDTTAEHDDTNIQGIVGQPMHWRMEATCDNKTLDVTYHSEHGVTPKLTIGIVGQATREIELMSPTMLPLFMIALLAEIEFILDGATSEIPTA